MCVLARVEGLELHQPRMVVSNAALRDNKNDGVHFAAHKEIRESLSESNKAETHAQDGYSAPPFVEMFVE